MRLLAPYIFRLGSWLCEQAERHLDVDDFWRLTDASDPKPKAKTLPVVMTIRRAISEKPN